MVATNTGTQSRRRLFFILLLLVAPSMKAFPLRLRTSPNHRQAFRTCTHYKLSPCRSIHVHNIQSNHPQQQHGRYLFSRHSLYFFRSWPNNAFSTASSLFSGRSQDENEDCAENSSACGKRIIYLRSLDDIQKEIMELTGENINIKSHKQISLAIFGRVQSVNRSVLLDAAKSAALGEKQRRLAALVLECRDQLRQYKGSDTKNTNKSTNTQDWISEKDAEETLGIPRPGQNQPDERGHEGVVEEEDEEDMKVGTDIKGVLQDPTGKPYSPYDPSQYDTLVDSLFENAKNQIHEYWLDVLKQLTRPSARALVAQLDSTICPFGFDPLAAPRVQGGGGSSEDANSVTTSAGKKGSFLSFCRDAKKTHPDCIVVTRCGDFYETFGIDAIMLVEHCGLNPMAGKSKAGFPFRNIQTHLDCLTQKGFRVAVYEEAADTDASSGAGAKAGAKSRLKSRFLAHIISPASTTYMYNLVLLGNTADTLAMAIPARPYVGVLCLAAGYTLVEVSLEERSVRVSERLTAEAVACRLAAYPPASPLLLVPSPTDYQTHNKDYARLAPFLPSVSKNDPGSRLPIKVIPPTIIQEPTAGVSEIDRARKSIISAILQMSDLEETEREQSVNDFTLIASSNHNQPVHGSTHQSAKTQTYPLHVETATQLGLLQEKTIPSLMNYLLPDSAPAATRRFLRRFLLAPPPPKVCEAMSELVSKLKEEKNPIPPLAVPPLGKVLALLRAGQASAVIYGEILQSLFAFLQILDGSRNDGSGNGCSQLIEPLLTILEHESGMAADCALKKRLTEAMETIEKVVSPLHHATSSAGRHSNEDPISDFGSLIPSGFLERNEATWRGRVQPSVVGESYENVKSKGASLAQAVAEDFFCTTMENNQFRQQKNPIVQDVFNNLLAIKELPTWVDRHAKEKYLHPRDRNGKLLRNRFTTERVQTALGEYVAACEEACNSVSDVLTKLSQRLYDDGHIPTIVQAAHANLILSSAFHHVRKANSLGWNCATVYEASDPQEKYRDTAAQLENLWPYWMDRSTAVTNTFKMKDLFLLTAPNMSGKSTLQRSTAAACLLTVCGLCAPFESGSRVRRFDHIFVRGASGDVPSENKSAFGAEMADCAALLRVCGNRSLVFVDELGRGTSPRDGTRLAGAVLEALAKAGTSGMFATHLHDILLLPLESSERIVKKRMAIHNEEEKETGEGSAFRTHYQWTYRLADGVCTDSMALVTAAQFGLPKSVLARAEELSSFVPKALANPEDVSMVEENCYDVSLVGDCGTDSDEKANHLCISMPQNREGATMQDIARLVMNSCGQVPFSVPPGWSPPASLENQSCVYILQLTPSFEGGPNCYYVGETDSFQQRLNQHRAKGGRWAMVDAIAFPISNGKSAARALESVIIQRMARLGIPLQSIHDGRTLRSSRQKYS